MTGPKRLSRLEFLRLAGFSAGAVVLSCSPSPPAAVPTAAPAAAGPTPAPKPTAAPAAPTSAPAQPTAAPPAPTQAPAPPTAAPAQAGSKKVVLQAATWLAAKLPSLYKWKADYEQQFPDRSVEILREDYDLTKALLEVKQKKSHADLILPITAFIDMAPAVEAGIIAPFGDRLPKDWSDSLAQAFLDESSYQGKVYQWPLGQVGTTINFRKSLLAEAGHPGDSGATLSEYLTVCQDIQAKLKAADGSQVFGNSLDLAWWRAPTTVGINMMGRDFFGKDGYLAWDDKRLIDVFNTLKQLAQFAPREIFLPGYSSVDAFAAGKTGIFFGQSEQVFYLANSSWGLGDLQLAYPPVFPGGENNPRSIVASSGAAFYQYGNMDNAWHFFEWLWPKEEFQQAIATEGRWIPVNQKFSDAKWMPPIVTDLVGLIKTGTFIPATLHYLELATHAQNALTGYLLGDIKTPEEAIAAGKKNFDDAVSKSG
jgi:ABC-type glycerol-3-phosphate transport system substrate-binding protein